jgi:hypothetical protein
MYKFFYEGEDRAIVVVSAGNKTTQVLDEVRQYQDGQYVGSSEATVFRLVIHLPGQQLAVVFIH